MPIHDYIDVQVFVDGRPLQEYSDPDNEESSEDQIMRYIEATVGQRFEVLVRWLPGFQLKKASNLVHTLCLDGLSWVPDKPIDCKGLGTTNNVLQVGQSYRYGTATVNLGEGRIRKSYYNFGALDISMLAYMLLFLPYILQRY